MICFFAINCTNWESNALKYLLFKLEKLLVGSEYIKLFVYTAPGKSLDFNELVVGTTQMLMRGKDQGKTLLTVTVCLEE